MDIIAATSMAFVAGVAEGGSVLKQYTKTHDSEEQSVIAPSLVYGTLSLPLTVIGSSPSVELIARCSGFKISGASIVNQEIDDKEVGPKSFNMKSSEPNKQRVMKLGLTGNVDLQAQIVEKLTNPAGGQNVTQMREDNRRAIAAMQQNRSEDGDINKVAGKVNSKAVAEEKKIKSYAHQRSISSNTSPLLGRGLPTAFAENMKRARVLCFGYGLAGALVAYQEYQYKNSKDDINKNVPQTPERWGRDAAAVKTYAECKECELGVSLRIIDGLQESGRIWRINDKTKSKLFQQKASISAPCSLPIICSREIGVMAPRRSIPSDEHVPQWYLGTTRSEWDDLPLYKQMYFGDNNDSRRFILLESLLSTSVLDGITVNRGNASHDLQFVQQAELNSRKIQHVLKAKNDNDAGVIHIIVGTTVVSSEDIASIDILPSDKVFLNSMGAIASCITGTVNDFFDRGSNQESETVETPAAKDDFHNKFSDTITAVKADDEKKLPTNFFLKTVDSVGRKIRHGGETIVNSVSHTVDAIDSVGRKIRSSCKTVLTKAGSVRKDLLKSLKISASYRATINIYSDDPSLASWLNEFLGSKEFRIVWHDVRRANLSKTITNDDNSLQLYLVLCSNDDATIYNTTALMSTLRPGYSNNIIPIVETLSAKNTLKSFRNIDDDPEVPHSSMEIICIESIHEDLIAFAKNLLVRKRMSPSQMKKAISSKMPTPSKQNKEIQQ